MNCNENAENCDKKVDEQAWRGHKKRTRLHRRSMRTLGKCCVGDRVTDGRILKLI